MPIQSFPAMTHALVNLNLDAVALVAEGANSRADIILTKRREPKSMTFEELIKAMNDEQAKIVNDHIAGLVAAKDGEIGKLKTDLEVAKSAPPAATPPANDDVLKNVSPEVRKMFEDMQSTMKSLVTEQENALAKERYEKVKALPVPEEDLKGVLKAASPAVYEILEKAAKAVEEACVPRGSDTNPPPASSGSNTFYAELEKAATKLQETDKCTFEAAFTKACEQNPELYLKYVKGVK